jgi:hypothetical protein
MPTAAQLMVKCLENEGVSVVFGVPGEENIRFIQALAASPIRYVLTRHEQGAAARSRFCATRSGPWCWPATVPRAVTRPQRWFGSPTNSVFRWQTLSTARV